MFFQILKWTSTILVPIMQNIIFQFWHDALSQPEAQCNFEMIHSRKVIQIVTSLQLKKAQLQKYP